MSNNPTSFRLPLNIEGKADPNVVEAMQWHDDAINDLQQSIPAIMSQITALKPSTGSSTTTQNVTNTSETTVIVQANTIGAVNNQTGNTSYASQQSDYGSIIVFDGSSAIAVTLTTGTVIQPPWMCFISNQSTANLTLTPASGNINFGGSLVLPGGSWVAVFYDGTNFYAVGSS